MTAPTAFVRVTRGGTRPALAGVRGVRARVAVVDDGARR